MCNAYMLFNSLGPSDTIWRWRSWSALAQVMACCLTAPSHYLNHCWLIISKVLWHSSEDIVIRRFEDTNQLSKITFLKLDMSTARWRLKSPRSLSGTSAHATTVTEVNIMVMNGWLTSFSFIVNRLPHSWDKTISDSDLETPRSRSWVWSKGKVIQLTQYHINSLPFHLTSIRPAILEIELFRNLTLKHPRSRSWVRAKV